MASRPPDRLLANAPAGADLLAWAPGRANLIGEYTDIADGYVLPVGLDLRTWAIGRSGGDRLRLRSLDEPGAVEVDLATGDGPTEGWGRYASAVVRALRDAGFRLQGFDGVIASDVPIGAGLSSSAALEVCLAHAVLRETPSIVDLARACRRAENAYVGVQSGIMDPLASAAAAEGRALLIDCRSLDLRSVPLPADVALVVVDSGVRRSLSDGRYNQVRRDLDEAARVLGVAVLRNVEPDQLRSAIDSNALTGSVARRARHVVSENGRVLAAAAALEAGDVQEAAGLFAASHRSLREDLAVSTAELDALVDIAVATPGVIAARMTGAGFGGCTVNLVRADAAPTAAAAILAAYRARTGQPGNAWVTRAGSGAGRAPILPAEGNRTN